MGLRCTVFGHKWGDADTEREREEAGSEVVATVREFRACRRCGAEDVLGTSKEVTSLPSQAESDPRGEPPAPDGDAGEEAESFDPEIDDGVILEEDGDDDVERNPREWPGRPERDGVADQPPEPGPWPETARESDDESREERFVGVGADRTAAGRDEPDQVRRTSAVDTDERRSVDPDERSPAGRGDGPTSGREEHDGAGGSGEIIEAGEGDTEASEGGTEASAGDTDASEGVIEEGEAHVGSGAGADPGRDDDPGARTEGTDQEGDEDEHEHGSEARDAGGVQREDGDTRAPGSGQPRPDGVDDPRRQPDGQSGEANESGGSTTDETMMGPDATHRPEDDAEVLEATGPNEQSRATAGEPVDPTDHAPATDPEETPPESGPSLDPNEPSSGDEPAPEDIEYYCPECAYVDDSTWPSRRAGDVCPNCRRSYLAERRH